MTSTWPWPGSIDKDVIQVHGGEDIELLGWDLIDEALEARRSIGKAERHDLVFEVTIPSSEGGFPFITFADPHRMVRFRQIQLGEALGPTLAVE